MNTLCKTSAADFSEQTIKKRKNLSNPSMTRQGQVQGNIPTLILLSLLTDLQPVLLSLNTIGSQTTREPLMQTWRSFSKSIRSR